MSHWHGWDMRSIPNFATVANGQNYDLLPVEVIESNIRSLSEFNDPFAEFRRHLFDWATDLWMGAESFDSLPNCLDGTHSSVAAVQREELMESGHIEQR